MKYIIQHNFLLLYFLFFSNLLFAQEIEVRDSETGFPLSGVLINNNDNYKNRLQVIIQKEFKITPDYIELKNNKANEDNLYCMGVYICFNKKIYDYNIEESKNFDEFNSFEKIHDYLNNNNELLIFLSKSEHKIKKKAEQLACKIAIDKIELIK